MSGYRASNCRFKRCGNVNFGQVVPEHVLVGPSISILILSIFILDKILIIPLYLIFIIIIKKC